MSKRLVKKAALEAVDAQERSLRIVQNLLAKLEKKGISNDFDQSAKESIQMVEKNLINSLEWTVGIHEIGD